MGTALPELRSQAGTVTENVLCLVESSFDLTMIRQVNLEDVAGGSREAGAGDAPSGLLKCFDDFSSKQTSCACH